MPASSASAPTSPARHPGLAVRCLGELSWERLETLREADASLDAVEEILTTLLPRNLAIQVYRALLENAAGFYGSQMSAMDNATRNAGDMIGKLTLNYNRTRQANITRELIEIISGAEAL